MEGGDTSGAGILFQMSEKGGNQKPGERYPEEQKASDAGGLSILWYQGIPYWKRLIVLSGVSRHMQITS